MSAQDYFDAHPMEWSFEDYLRHARNSVGDYGFFALDFRIHYSRYVGKLRAEYKKWLDGGQKLLAVAAHNANPKPGEAQQLRATYEMEQMAHNGKISSRNFVNGSVEGIFKDLTNVQTRVNDESIDNNSKRSRKVEELTSKEDNKPVINDYKAKTAAEPIGKKKKVVEESMEPTGIKYEPDEGEDVKKDEAKEAEEPVNKAKTTEEPISKKKKAVEKSTEPNGINYEPDEGEDVKKTIVPLPVPQTTGSMVLLTTGQFREFTDLITCSAAREADLFRESRDREREARVRERDLMERERELQERLMERERELQERLMERERELLEREREIMERLLQEQQARSRLELGSQALSHSYERDMGRLAVRFKMEHIASQLKWAYLQQGRMVPKTTTAIFNSIRHEYNVYYSRHRATPAHFVCAAIDSMGVKENIPVPTILDILEGLFPRLSGNAHFATTDVLDRSSFTDPKEFLLLRHLFISCGVPFKEVAQPAETPADAIVQR